MAAHHTSYYALLHELLDTTPAVIIRRAETPHGDIGIVRHTSNTITIDHAATAPAFGSALIRATLSLHRGSAHAADQVREGEVVRRLSAALAVAPVHRLDGAITLPPEQIAQAIGVDLETVLLGIQLAGTFSTRRDPGA